LISATPRSSGLFDHRRLRNSSYGIAEGFVF
jgi:hypothetical protein